MNEIYLIEEVYPYDGSTTVYTTFNKADADVLCERLNQISQSDTYYIVEAKPVSDSLPDFVPHSKRWFNVCHAADGDIAVYTDAHYEDYDNLPIEGNFVFSYDPTHYFLDAYVWADSIEEAKQIAADKLQEHRNGAKS